MGMYTELVLACEIARANDIQIKTLQDMISGDADSYADGYAPEEHALFKTDRWKWMLRSDSYYFSGDTNSTFRWDDPSNAYILTVRCNLKNYRSEIDHFCDWVCKMSCNDGFVGYKLYEENENPTLIYFYSGKVEYK